jgi:hypothetical protein
MHFRSNFSLSRHTAERLSNGGQGGSSVLVIRPYNLTLQEIVKKEKHLAWCLQPATFHDPANDRERIRKKQKNLPE